MGNKNLDNFSELYDYIDYSLVTQRMIGKNFSCFVQNITKSNIIENHYQLDILLGNVLNGQFFIYSHKIQERLGNMDIDTLKGMKINILSFRFNIKQSNLFIEIEDFKPSNIYNDNKISSENEFFFSPSKFVSSYEEVELNNIRLFSIYLEYLGNNYFSDINGKKIKIETNQKLKKFSKYYFSNLYLDTNGIKYIRFSSHCDITDNKLLNLIDDNQIKSGIISKIYLYENKIECIINNENLEVLLNNKLMKTISTGCICKFINFDNQIKDNKKRLKYNDFSTIFYEEKTILRIKFEDLKKKENKYNILEINSQQYTINKEIIEIPINSVDKKNSFVQKIIYKGNKNSNKVEFLLELYKNKINNYKSYLNLLKDGYSYDYLYESKNKDFLPKTQKIMIDNNNELLIDNPDTFGNNYREKFGIINIPKQIEFSNNNNKINNIISNQIKDKQGQNKIRSRKILILIKNNGVKKILNFKLAEKKKNKKPFKMEQSFERELSCFYEQYKDNYKDFYNNKSKITNNYKLLFNEEKSSFAMETILMDLSLFNDSQKSYDSKDMIMENKFNNNLNKGQNIDKSLRKEIEINENEINYRKYFELGFKKYTFNDSEEDYENIKKLGFLYILKYFDYKNSLSDIHFNSLMENYRNIIKSLDNFDYIDRIRVILGFINDKIFDEEKRKYLFEYNLVNLDNKRDIKKNINYFYEAYHKFFKIIEQLEENSAFFTVINQLNSLIFYESFYKTEMYSGTMITINDMKLEIAQYVKRYFFLTTYKGDCYAHYSIYTKMAFYHPLMFLESNTVFIQDKKKLNNSIVAILFLIFHVICGHSKSNIKHFDDTPSQFYDNNYEIIQFKLGEITDSGNIFEYFLTSNLINISNLYYKDDVSPLLSENLYIGNNFEELNAKLSSLGISEKSQKILNKNKPIILNDISNMSIRDIMKILFDLKKECTEKEFNRLLRDNENYKLMMEKLRRRYKLSNYKP